LRLSGEKTFDAPREEVWRVLVDPESMARTMPGIESFDVLDERHWTASVKIRLGLTRLRMKVHFDKVEERKPEFSKLVAQSEGVGSVLRMETSFELLEEGSRTRMLWTAEVSLGGRLGALGSRALRPLVDRQVGNVLDVIEEQLQHGGG
jgi:carbon monoxide dehydrogenase subunit G